MAEEKRQEEQEFSFVKEKIKRQRFYQNRVFRRVVLQIVLGAVCGAVACFTFVVLHPWMDEKFGEEEKKEIVFPSEDEEEKEPAEEPAEPAEPVVITEKQELEIEDYRKLYGKLRAVALESERCLVTVTAASSDMDWFNETYESQKQLSGLLVGNNGVELVILTVYAEVSSANELQVMFADKSVLNAVLKNHDVVTDLAVLSVNLADVQESTMESIRMAELGSSKSLRAGEPVIAVGSPAGTAGSVIYGTLTAGGFSMSVIDGEYDLLITDMNRTGDGSGVLLNLDGQVIGLIEHRYLNPNNKNVLTAYSISDMKDVIEHLSNSQDLVYIGVMGENVTEEIAQAVNLPKGVYITGVEMDSPAMNAGLQQGDVITVISGQEIESVSQIQEMLLKFSKEQEIQVNVMRQGKEGYKEISCKVVLNCL